MMEDWNFEEDKSAGKPQKGATYALIVLTAINTLNYMDRYVPSATKELYKDELDLTDSETSLPLTAFMLVYMLTSPIFGMLADSGFSRKLLICIGIILWSLATGAAFFATGFWSFLICRTFVGVGEAAFATIAPSLLSDMYPPEKRNRIMTILFMATPVGSALGFLLGGLIGDLMGWRYAFLLCGLPGVFIALLVLLIQDPGVGTYESTDSDSSTVSWIEAIKVLAKNKLYINIVIGYTFIVFAMGALADWLPAYLNREDNAKVYETGLIVGAITVVGGIGGTILGGVIGDQLAKRQTTKNPYMAISCISVFIGAVFTIITLVLRSAPLTVVAFTMLLAQIALWCYSGPINALQANIVSSNVRSRAFSLTILCIHLFGDAISPVIIGKISDATGSLFFAVCLIPLFMVIAAIVWAIGWRFIGEDVGQQYKRLMADTSFDLDDDSDFAQAASRIGSN